MQPKVQTRYSGSRNQKNWVAQNPDEILTSQMVHFKREDRGLAGRSTSHPFPIHKKVPLVAEGD